MKQSIARALRSLANRFDPPPRCVINIQNINGEPVTADRLRLMQAQQNLDRAHRRMAAAGKAGGEEFSRRLGDS